MHVLLKREGWKVNPNRTYLPVGAVELAQMPAIRSDLLKSQKAAAPLPLCCHSNYMQNTGSIRKKMVEQICPNDEY